jgi:predicted metalloprotease with PDZ domain
VYERGGVQTTVQVEVGSQADRPALADRPWFGAFPAAPDGNPSTGLTIGYVGDGSPAATAGLMVGDQVLTVNGADVTQGPGALATLRSMSPGDTLVLGIMRDGKPMTITVVLGSQADNPNREAEIAARQAHRQERRDNRQQRQSDRRGEWGIPGIRPGGPHGPGGPGGNAGFGQGGFSGGAAA